MSLSMLTGLTGPPLTSRRSRSRLSPTAPQRRAIPSIVDTPTLTTSRAPQTRWIIARRTELLNYAGEKPAVQVNEDTNTVTPPDTSYLDKDAAQQVAQKVTAVQERITKVLTDGAGTPRR